MSITWFNLKTYLTYYWLSPHTWLLPLQNELYIFYECMLLNFMLNDGKYLIYIFYKTHNLQLGNEYNYVNLITYLDHVAKLHMLNVKW
jgi:hypothetical protein